MGFSLAGEETVVAVPEYNISFDVGRAPREIIPIDNVCLTGEGGRSWNSGPGYIFYSKYIEPLESPDNVSFSSDTMAAVSYVDGTKLESQMRRTDGAYWEILDFEFLEGRPLTREDHDSGEFVAVINRSSRDVLLGDGEADRGRRRAWPRAPGPR